jgi:hypothetical protein
MVKMLQTAATTAGKMLAVRLNPVIGDLDNVCDASLIVVALAVVIAKFNSLIWQSALNKARLTINTCHSTAIVTQVNHLAAEGLFLAHGFAIFNCWDRPRF